MDQRPIFEGAEAIRRAQRTVRQTTRQMGGRLNRPCLHYFLEDHSS